MNEQAIIWANKLGVLPVNFLHRQSSEVEKYAMLNGYANNFCLSFTPEDSADIARSRAWSANMSNYVSIEGDNVRLFSLHKTEPESIPYYYVYQNLSKFYEYLGINQMKTFDSIVPFVIKHFRMVRNAMREEGTAIDALKVFLYMLSQLEIEGIGDWKLPEGTDAIVEGINKLILEQTYDSFRAGIAGMNLKPDVQLLLRHSAGIVFQEANYFARFSNQLELFPTEMIRYEMSPKMIGSYFTPAYIARTIVEEALRYIDLESKDTIKVFDPACGSGVFLVEILHQLDTKRFKGNVEVTGWDIDPIAVDMAKFVLQFEKREWGERMNYVVTPKDSMAVEYLWPDADVILMNPPYNSWTNMSDEQRQQSVDIIGTKARPNMASVFYLRAVRSLSPDGVIGSLIPSSFLTADSHAVIRNEAIHKVSPKLICHLGNFVFTSAMADVSIVVASNHNNTDKVEMVWTKNVDEVTPVALRSLRRIQNGGVPLFDHRDFSIYQDSLLELSERDNWMPLPFESLQQKRFIEQRMQMGGLVKAGELFDIMLGVRTGANDVFIISGEEFKKVPTKERSYFRPSIDSTSLRDGQITPSNYLFYPYPEDEKGFADENDLKEKLPYTYHNIFEPKMQLLLNRQIKNGEWWQLSRPRIWQFQPKEKIVSTEFGKAGSFAYDRRGEYIVERGLGWMPINPNVTSDFYYFYLAILNSKYFNSLLQIYARQLAGGSLYNLEGKYVRNIPLPTMEAVDYSTRELLISLGMQISKKGSLNIEGLSAIVRNIYGK